MHKNTSPMSALKISTAYDLSCGELKPLVGEVCASDAIYNVLQI